ncbi:MAG: hypothetical protein ABIH34_03725 [Nanoarchaeota archaeon]
MEAQFSITTDSIKVSIMEALKVFVVAAALVGIGYYLDTLMDLEDIVEVFVKPESLPSGMELLSSLAIATFSVSLIGFVLAYLTEGKRRWDFYPDSISFERSVLLFSAGKATINFSNVVSIRLKIEGIDHLIGTTTLSISLTGLKENELKIPHVHHGDGYIPVIQQLINAHRARQAAHYQVQDTINQTLDQL